MTGLDFDYHNLDYFMVTSELYSYTGASLDYTFTEESDYPYNPDEVISKLLGSTYIITSQNTLGYLTADIAERTGGALDSIKVTCVDTVPQYIFAKTDKTTPHSPLFGPTIVSSERYSQLSDRTKFGYLYVDVAASESPETIGINSRDLSNLERKFYSAKVPLADMLGSFNYPIETVTLYKVKDQNVFTLSEDSDSINYGPGEILDSVDLDASDYEIPEGLQNLYFYEPLDVLINGPAPDLPSYAIPTYQYEEEGLVYYMVEIKIAKVIPDDGNLSEEQQRNLVAQATMYPILDYFDQYTFAATTADMIAEIGYTEILTLSSTLFTALALAFVTVAVKGAQALATSYRAIPATVALMVADFAKQCVINVPLQIAGEMFEEVMIDSFVETYFESIARELGWSEGLGRLLSMLVTTLRETKMFGIFNLGSDSNVDIDNQLENPIEQILTHPEIMSELSQRIAEYQSEHGTFKTIRFLRENEAWFKEMESELELVPDTRVTALEKAKIVASGILAGLSLFVPGLHLQKFAMYGFSPILELISNKLPGLGKPGTTTAWRAAVNYQRKQNELSQDIDAKNAKIMEAKRGPAAAEGFGELLFNAPTVSSIGAGYSGRAVEYLVNSKVETFDANIYTSLSSQSSSQGFYAPSLIDQDINTKTMLLENEIEILESLTDTSILEPISQVRSESNDIVFSFEGEQEGAMMSDEVYSWGGRLIPVSSVNPYSTDVNTMPTIGKSLQFARSLFRVDGLDLKKPTVGLWVDATGDRHIIAPGVEFTSVVNGRIMIIGEADAKYTPILLEHLGYGMDVSPAQSWKTDVSQHIQLVYVEDLTVDERLLLPVYSDGVSSIAQLSENGGISKHAWGLAFRQNLIVPQVKMDFNYFKAIESLYYDLMSSFEINYEIDKKNPRDVMSMLSRYIQFNAKVQIEGMDIYTGATDSQITDFMSVIDNMFDFTITSVFENTMKHKGENYVKSIIKQAFERATLEAILANIKDKLAKGEELTGDNFATKVEEYLSAMTNEEKNYLIKHITKIITPLFMAHLLESFFTTQSSRDPIKHIMAFSRHIYTSIGYTKESRIFTAIAPQILFKAFVESGYAVNKFNFYEFIQHNPDNNYRSFVVNALDSINDMKDFKKKINNGVEFTYSISNRDVGDVISAHVIDTLYLTFEAKASRNSRPTALLKNLGVDLFRSLFSASIIPILNDEYIADRQEEVAVTPTKDGDLGDAFLPYGSKLVTIHKRSDFRKNVKSPKGDILEEANELIAALINEKGFGSLQDIKNMFRQSTFKTEIIEILKPVFKGRQFGKDIQDEIFNNAKSDFTSKINYDSLLREIDGQYRFVKDFRSWVYVATDQKLKFSNFPSSITFEVIEGEKVELSYGSNYEFSTGLMLTTDENGKLGIIRGEQLKFGLPRGVESGDIRNGRDYAGIWLTDGRGNILLSPVDIFNNKIRTDQEMAVLIRDTFKAYQIEYFYGYKETKIINGFKGTYYRSSCFLAGDGIRSVIQEVTSTLVPTGTHKDILAGNILERTVLSKPYKLNTKRDTDPIFNAKINSISEFLFQFTHYISNPYFSDVNLGAGIDTMYIGKDLFNLQIDADIYSNEKFLEVLNGLQPESSDPLYTPGSKIYSAEEPISIDPEDDNFWLRLFSRATIKDNGELDYNLDNDKEFYNSWLLVIQNEILRGNPNSLFSEEESSLFFDDNGDPKSLDTTKSDPTYQEFQLIRALKDIMLNKFGFTMYFFIITGIASFRFDDLIYIDYLGLHQKHFEKIIALFNIKPSSTTKYIQDSYSDSVHSYERIMNLVFDSLMFGYTQVIGDKVMELHPSTNTGILRKMFTSLNLKRFGKTYHGQIKSIFRSQYYSKVIDPRNIVKKQTNGRGKISVFLKKFAIDSVENIFSDSGVYEGLLNPDYEVEWKRRTRQQLCSIIDMCIDNPTYEAYTSYTSDIVREIRLALSQHRNAKIIIKSTGGSGRISAYASNPLINRGLIIEVPYSDLKKLLDEDVRLALMYSVVKQSTGKATIRGPLTIYDQNNAVEKMGWYLDIDTVFDDRIKNKIIDAYKVLHDFVEKAKNKNGGWLRDTMTIRGYVQNGGGFDKNADIKNVYGKSLGFNSHTFEFNPSHPTEYNNAIASIIFYLLTVRDSYIIIDAGSLNFLALDILGFYKNNDFSSSLFQSPLSLNLVWGKPNKQGLYDHLTPDEYNNFAEKFKGIFTEDDLRLFTAFSNMKGGDDNGLILRYIWNVVKQVYERRLEGEYSNTRYMIQDITIHDLNRRITSLDTFPF